MLFARRWMSGIDADTCSEKKLRIGLPLGFPLDKVNKFHKRRALLFFVGPLRLEGTRMRLTQNIPHQKKGAFFLD
jgi:hypothetical protein